MGLVVGLGFALHMLWIATPFIIDARLPWVAAYDALAREGAFDAHTMASRSLGGAAEQLSQVPVGRTLDELERVKALADAGLLTADEAAQMKARVLHQA